MEWMEVRIDTTKAGIEPICDMLTVTGQGGFMVDDGEEFEQFLKENRKSWDFVDDDLMSKKSGMARVTVYYTADEAGLSALEILRADLEALKARRADIGFGPLSISIANIDEEDWANAWKRYYKPMNIGERLLVVPEWEEADNPDSRVVFLNNPGMTFGTGAHASTRLCMKALEETVLGGEKALDLGCGSGILSIIALLLGAKSSLAVDIDPNCEKTVRENARLNGVDDASLPVKIGDILTDDGLRACVGGGYDLICANIVADVIIALAPYVRQALSAGGRFISSGVIDVRRHEVEHALESAGFLILSVREEDGWVCFIVS